MYTPQDYILFLTAIILALSGLALLGVAVEWQDRRRAKRLERQLRELNRREEIRRRHDSYLTKMQELLESVEGRRGA